MIVAAVTVVVQGLFSQRFLLVTFDAEAAKVAGVKTGWWSLALNLSIGVTAASAVHEIGALPTFAQWRQSACVPMRENGSCPSDIHCRRKRSGVIALAHATPSGIGIHGRMPPTSAIISGGLSVSMLAAQTVALVHPKPCHASVRVAPGDGGLAVNELDGSAALGIIPAGERIPLEGRQRSGSATAQVGRFFQQRASRSLVRQRHPS
ncbi:MAG TPA: metal ABC transporter permease [Vicinamibacterales bacterium]|nr:metal ABC transporter permease [Vicinamibacterales bacterium]